MGQQALPEELEHLVRKALPVPLEIVALMEIQVTREPQGRLDPQERLEEEEEG